MTASFEETLKYWGKIAEYILLLMMITGIFAGPGFMLISPAYLSAVYVTPGIILLLIGAIVLSSGLFGISYKVISDGFEEGSVVENS